MTLMHPDAFELNVVKAERDKLLADLAAAKAEIAELVRERDEYWAVELVKATNHVQRAVLEEREECAALCESRVENDGQTDDWSNGWNSANYGAATAIRGRGRGK